jgi:hypothetical protein
MKVINNPQYGDRYDLYHALCHALANSRGNTVQTMPIEHIHHAEDLAESAYSHACDRVYIATRNKTWATYGKGKISS